VLNGQKQSYFSGIAISIFFVSLCILSYEILLMRVLSITSWSHFAYMVISIALLGFGASGTFISLFQKKLKTHFYPFFTLFSFLFSFSLFICFVVSQKIPFNLFLIVWDNLQYFYLAICYLVLFVPFFLGATCIGLSFLKFSRRINRVYFYNLLGSGGGALIVILFMYLLSLEEVLLLIIILAFFAAALSSINLSGKIFSVIVSASAAAILFFFFHPPQLQISQYKGLSTSLKLPRAKIIEEKSSPLALIDVVESPAIRCAPGLSLNYKGSIPPQLALFLDADSICAITDFQGNLSNLKYLEHTSPALPYQLLTKPRVLVVGAGGGSDVLRALYHKASHIEAVEVNPQIVHLVKEEYADFSNHLYSYPQLEVVIAEGRGFIESTSKKYDLIQITLLDSFAASASGVYALSESYLYTTEALEKYIQHLTQEGILSITRWLKMPPRDGIKLFATAVKALENLGIKDVSSHLIFIRSWADSTLLIKRSPFTSSQINIAKEFARERLFDLIWSPSLKPEETNQYNILPRPFYYEAAREILFGDRDDFYQRYLFFVRPAVDNSPYFFHFFKWKSLPYLLKTMGREWLPFIEWGYIVLVFTLLQAIAASIFLIIFPLLFLRKRKTFSGRRLQIFLYFLFLGVGYMFIEISFIQKFTLFLSYPVYAVAVVMAAFLFFSGCGSYFSQKIRISKLSNVATASGAIIVISLVYLVYLGNLFIFFIQFSDGIKILLSLLFIAPLAFFMGIPFPSGLQEVSLKASPLVPWAWGINGCASVISPVLATVLAISLGFNLVILIALTSYALAVICFHEMSNVET